MSRDHLDRAVQRFGPGVLADPTALRAALRDTGCPPAEVDAALAAALTPESGRSTVPDRSADVRVTWDGPVARPTTPGPAPTTPLPRRRRRRIAPLVAAGLAVLALVAAAVLVGFPRGEPAPVDRFAVDQVALRYAALGPDLLTGAQRCGPARAEPGERERVLCEFGAVTMTLATLDDVSRLDPRRETAATGPDSLRGARFTGDVAAVAFDEQRSGQSTVYWDVEIPRPVSAEITTGSGTLLDLVAFFDARRFAAQERPAVPGEAFSSGELWAFARSQADVPDARCRAEAAEDGERASVGCTLPGGLEAVFVQDVDADSLADTRAVYASDQGTVAGTHSFRPWSASDRELVGQLGQFVSSNDDRRYLYWDDDVSRCWGLLNADPSLSQEELLRRWGGTAS